MKINNINKCKCGCDDVSFIRVVGPHNQVGSIVQAAVNG